MDTPTFSTPQQTPSIRRIVLSAVIVSTLVGGVVGGTVGYFAPQILPRTTSSTTAMGAVKGITTVEETSAAVDAVKKVSPAVVSVILSQDLSKLKQQPELNPFNDFFFGFPFSFRQQEPQSGTKQIAAGTGFLVSSDGMVLTNKHVIDQQQGNEDNIDVTVIFNDKSEHKAKILGTDPLNDIAVLKIDGSKLPVVQFGDSEALQLGQMAIAIGNALGQYQNTVTRGVVSGLHRTITAGDGSGAQETIQNAIQTDAAINHGNSGGPLIDAAGNVIGINTAIDEQGQLVGFAIPANVAKEIVDSIQKNGKIVRPYLGVRYVMIDSTIQQKNNLSADYGALILRGTTPGDLAVIPGSPADKAGLVENDIILEINGKKMSGDTTPSTMMQGAKVGDTVTLKILHTGKEKTVTTTLEAFDQKTAGQQS